MPKRFLPNSNPTRYRALKAVKDRKDQVPPPADIPLTAGTISRFDLFYPDYKTKYLAVSTGLSGQTGLTNQIKTAKVTAGYFVSDFIDALQNAIRRGAFPESDRALFGLPVSHPLRPQLVTDQDVLDWGERVHDGETARIAAGGAPITFPSLAQVDTEVGNFRTLNLNQAAAKTVYDNAQEALEADNIEADKLILKMWNEIEAAFDEGNKPSMRRKAREWGVYYQPTPGEALSPSEFSIVGTVTDSVSGAPISDAVVIVQSPEVIVTTDAQGKYFMPAMAVGSYTMFVHKDGYINQNMGSVAVTAGAVTTVDVQLVVGSGSGLGKVAGQVMQAGVGASATVGVQGTGISVNTDSSGNYILNDVPAGSQVIEAFLTSNPATTQPQNITVVSDATVIVNFNFS